MSDHGEYCPFLNRSDSRCSKNFSLERINNTYDYCFGNYSACTTYLELLVERRLRRAREAAGVAVGHGSNDRWQTEDDAEENGLVALTLGGRRMI